MKDLLRLYKDDSTKVEIDHNTVNGWNCFPFLKWHDTNEEIIHIQQTVHLYEKKIT